MHKISIITINYNNGSELLRTIESVISQNYTNFEYIVIDGNSRDHSVSVIKKYESKITKWVSEPDTGIYNAMNKGIRLATGNYLLFLNSGDTLYTHTILKDVVDFFVGGKDIYYGNLFFISKKEKFLRKYPVSLNFSYFYNNRSLPHPASFIKRDLFDKIFYYNEELNIVSDWEFFICAICKFNVTYKYLDLVISNFDTQGMSNKPEYKKMIEQERDIVMRNYFPSLLDDMEEINRLRKIQNNPKVKLLLEIEKSKVGRKISFLNLKLIASLFKNKN